MPPCREAWKNLDAAADSRRLLEFIDEFAQVSAVRAAKSRSFELLGACAGARLLDAGCGTGLDVLALLPEVLPGGEVVGVDSSSRALIEARAKAKGREGVSFEQADVTRLPFCSDRFDGARSDRTLSHIERPELAVAELVRVTRPGGRVVISEVMLPDARPRDLSAARRKQAKHVLAFVPLLLNRFGVEDIVIDRSEASVEVPPSVAEIIGGQETHVTLRFVHVGGTVNGRPD